VRAGQLLDEKLADKAISADWEQITREAGVSSIAPVDPDEEIESWRQPILLVVVFDAKRSMLDLISLEGELEVLLGHKLQLVTRNGLAARKLNGVIAPDAPTVDWSC